MFNSSHISLQLAGERARELRGVGARRPRFESQSRTTFAESQAPARSSRTLEQDIAALEEALAATPVLGDVEHRPRQGRVARITRRAHRSSRLPVSRG
jgi:hypothetical protein